MPSIHDTIMGVLSACSEFSDIWATWEDDRITHIFNSKLDAQRFVGRHQMSCFIGKIEKEDVNKWKNSQFQKK